MENPNLKWMIGGYPYFRKPPYLNEQKMEHNFEIILSRLYHKIITNQKYKKNWQHDKKNINYNYVMLYWKKSYIICDTWKLCFCYYHPQSPGAAPRINMGCPCGGPRDKGITVAGIMLDHPKTISTIDSHWIWLIYVPENTDVNLWYMKTHVHVHGSCSVISQTNHKFRVITILERLRMPWLIGEIVWTCITQIIGNHDDPCK